MLAPALRLVTAALARAIEARTGAAGAAVLAPLAALGAAPPPADTLVVSLVRLEPDKTPSFTPTRASEGGLRTETPVAVSAVLLISATHTAYDDALEAVDHTVGFFRHAHVFDSVEIAGLQRLTVEVETLSLEDLHHLWALVGAPYRPSVVVRMRLLGSEALLPEPIQTVTATAVREV